MARNGQFMCWCAVKKLAHSLTRAYTKASTAVSELYNHAGYNHQLRALVGPRRRGYPGGGPNESINNVCTVWPLWPELSCVPYIDLQYLNWSLINVDAAKKCTNIHRFQDKKLWTHPSVVKGAHFNTSYFAAQFRYPGSANDYEGVQFSILLWVLKELACQNPCRVASISWLEYIVV